MRAPESTPTIGCTYYDGCNSHFAYGLLTINNIPCVHSSTGSRSVYCGYEVQGGAWSPSCQRSITTSMLLACRVSVCNKRYIQYLVPRSHTKLTDTTDDNISHLLLEFHEIPPVQLPRSSTWWWREDLAAPSSRNLSKSTRR